jgi:hypothetical protein
MRDFMKDDGDDQRGDHRQRQEEGFGHVRPR